MNKFSSIMLVGILVICICYAAGIDNGKELKRQTVLEISQSVRPAWLSDSAGWIRTNIPSTESKNYYYYVSVALDESLDQSRAIAQFDVSRLTILLQEDVIKEQSFRYEESTTYYVMEALRKIDVGGLAGKAEIYAEYYEKIQNENKIIYSYSGLLRVPIQDVNKIKQEIVSRLKEQTGEVKQ